MAYQIKDFRYKNRQTDTKNICEKKLKKGVDKPFQKVYYNTRKEQTNNTYLATMYSQEGQNNG